MEKQALKEKTKVLKQSKRIILNFKKREVLDKALEVPKEVKKMGLKVGVYELGLTILSIGLSYSYSIAKIALEHNQVFLVIFFVILYVAQGIINNSISNFTQIANTNYNIYYGEKIKSIAIELFQSATGKIRKKQKGGNFDVIMDNVELSNALKRYLTASWDIQINNIFDLLKLIAVIIMIIGACYFNNVIPQILFISIIVVYAIVDFFSIVYLSIVQKEYRKDENELEDKSENILNDLIHKAPIGGNDTQMRLSVFSNITNEKAQKQKELSQKIMFQNLSIGWIKFGFQLGYLIFYFAYVGLDAINSDTLMDLTGNIVIIQNVANQISSFCKMLEKRSYTMIDIIHNEEVVKQVLQEYKRKEEEQPRIGDIKVAKTKITYEKQTKYDNPFCLINEENILIPKGSVAILRGASGSGKTTFEKMITNQIFVNGQDLPNLSKRYIFYSKSLQLGSLSIFDEMFTKQENPDLEKMKFLMENLHLWQELSANCKDVWEWMKQRSIYGGNKAIISDGQMQRLILAKILYHLNDNIDLLVLDEATSGLDDIPGVDSTDANKVLEFIVRFANKDKKRTVVISTHQNIDEFERNISRDFKIKNLKFRLVGNNSYVTKI